MSIVWTLLVYRNNELCYKSKLLIQKRIAYFVLSRWLYQPAGSFDRLIQMKHTISFISLGKFCFSLEFCTSFGNLILKYKSEVCHGCDFIVFSGNFLYRCTGVIKANEFIEAQIFHILQNIRGIHAFMACILMVLDIHCVAYSFTNILRCAHECIL